MCIHPEYHGGPSVIRIASLSRFKLLLLRVPVSMSALDIQNEELGVHYYTYIRTTREDATHHSDHTVTSV